MVSAATPSADPVALRLLDHSARCVRCGLCQPHCPTYGLDRQEAESPRGRISIAAALALGETSATDSGIVDAIDHCLSCRRCEAVCPAHVAFDALIADSRALLRRQVRPPWRQRLLETAIAWRWPLRLGWPLVRGLRRLLPTRQWRSLPTIPARVADGGLHPAPTPARGHVVLFTGCVAQHLDADVHRAAIRVLNRLGWDVWLPAELLCCGALHRHAGDPDGAAALAARGRRALRAVLDDADAVLTATSGCHADLVGALSPSPVRELLAFIADDDRLAQLPLAPRKLSIALHTPCTQATAVGRADATARVLGVLPGVTLTALPDRGCCGAAGSHALLHPARAADLRDHLLAPLDEGAFDLICSANVGCRLHLSAGVQRLPVRHPLELLAEGLQ